MPATTRGITNDGSPILAKLNEQIIKARSKMAPSPYNLWVGVTFKALRDTNAAARLLAPIRRTMPRFAAPSPE